MDGKRTRCLQIVSLHVPIYLLPFLRYSEIFVKNRHFIIPLLHSTPPLGGFPSEYRHPLWVGKTRMVSLSDGEKISKISLFVLTWSTNVTDNQTDRHCVTAKTALASHRAVRKLYGRGSLTDAHMITRKRWSRNGSDQYLQMQSRHSKHLAVSRTIEVVKIKVTFDL